MCSPITSDHAPDAAPHDHQHGGTTVQNEHGGHDHNLTVGDVDIARLGWDPVDVLTDFDYGTVTETRADGTVVREWQIVAYDKEIEIAPGVFFPAWTYNGRVPGPTLRANEGDLLRIHFVNAGSHPHTMHFHGIHSAYHDGVAGIGRGDVEVGDSITYEFTAKPFGVHLYHCHASPLKRHIHKGLYGAFIVNPGSGQARRQGEGAPSGPRRVAEVAGVRDGDERLRHQLRRRQRGLRDQLGRLPSHEAPDRDRQEPAGARSTWST